MEYNEETGLPEKIKDEEEFYLYLQQTPRFDKESGEYQKHIWVATWLNSHKIYKRIEGDTLKEVRMKYFRPKRQ